MRTPFKLLELPVSYPCRWVEKIEAQDGRRLVLRPVLPQDDAMERLFVAQGLTQRSRYQRFQVGMQSMPEALLHSFTHVDYHDHFALVAHPPGDAQLQAGDARFVREGPGLPRAEFAIAVADAWQGVGLGRHLMRRLVSAAEVHGIERLYGDVLRDNPAMLALASAEGFAVQRHPSDATLLRVARQLNPRSADAARGSQTAAGFSSASSA